MAEVIGALVLEVIGLSEFASLVLFSIGTTTITVGGIVGGAIIIGGSIGLQLLLTPRRPGLGSIEGPALPGPEAGHQPLRQPIPPRMVGYGRNRLGGAYVLYEASGGNSYDVIALHHGQVSAIIGYYLHDDVVTINGSGVVDVLGDGRYGSSKITIKTRLGLASETAYSEITTPLSSIWTANHKGNGIASLALICNQVTPIDDFPDIYPRGKPEPSVVADCALIFDPRDGTQSLGSPSTWKVSSNPIVQLLDVMSNADRGMGFDWASFVAPNLTALKQEADLCDELIAKLGGVEPRYASNGTYPLDADPADVIKTILDTCDGWISEDGNGALVVKVGVYRAPTLVINSKHIRGVQLQYDLPDEEAINELTIDYTEPLLDYKTSPGQPWRNDTDISERGKVLSQRLALPWVQSHSQARRLAKRRDAQHNATLRGTITTTLYGIQALSERWIKIEAPDLPDLADLVIENRGITIDLLSAQCVIKFVAVNPNSIDAWVPGTEEGSAPTIPSKAASAPPPVPAGLVATQENVGESGQRAIRVTFTNPGRSDLRYQMRWRINGSGSPFTEGSLKSPSTSGANLYIVDATGIASNTWEVALRSFAPTGPGSAWSGSTTVTIS